MSDVKRGFAVVTNRQGEYSGLEIEWNKSFRVIPEGFTLRTEWYSLEDLRYALEYEGETDEELVALWHKGIV